MAHQLSDAGASAFLGHRISNMIEDLGLPPVPFLAIAYFLTTFMFSSLSAHIVAFVATFLDAGHALGANPMLLTVLLAYFGTLSGCMVCFFDAVSPCICMYLYIYSMSILFLDQLFDWYGCHVLCFRLCVSLKMVYYRLSARLVLHCDLFYYWYGMVASLGMVELGSPVTSPSLSLPLTYHYYLYTPSIFHTSSLSHIIHSIRTTLPQQRISRFLFPFTQIPHVV